MSASRVLRRLGIGLLLVGVISASNAPVALAVTKVTLSSTSVAMTEGDSRTISVTLDEPIIGPGPDPVYFHLNLTSSDASRVTLSTPTINYTASDWFQHKTFDITAVHDGVHNLANTVTVSFIVDSDSEYYRNYTGNLVVTITDIDPAPVVASSNVTTTAPKATLAETGADMRQLEILSGLVSATLITIAVLLTRNSHRQTRLPQNTLQK